MHVASFHVCPFADPVVIPHTVQVAGSVHVASFHVCPLAQVVSFTLSLTLVWSPVLVLADESFPVSPLGKLPLDEELSPELLSLIVELLFVKESLCDKSDEFCVSSLEKFPVLSELV